ncbi:hypothetical protein MC885_004897 [Smutsia gigantea]|nr:hypothetical protein MC885_004897 [Smutsia gigantea]
MLCQSSSVGLAGVRVDGVPPPPPSGELLHPTCTPSNQTPGPRKRPERRRASPCSLRIGLSGASGAVCGEAPVRNRAGSGQGVVRAPTSRAGGRQVGAVRKAGGAGRTTCRAGAWPPGARSVPRANRGSNGGASAPSNRHSQPAPTQRSVLVPVPPPGRRQRRREEQAGSGAMGPLQETKEQRVQHHEKEISRSRIPRLILRPHLPQQKHKVSPASESPFSEEDSREFDPSSSRRSARAIRSNSFYSDDTGCPSSQSVSPVKTPSDTVTSPVGFCRGSDKDFTRKKCTIGMVGEGGIQSARYKKEQKPGLVKPVNQRMSFSLRAKLQVCKKEIPSFLGS